MSVVSLRLVRHARSGSSRFTALPSTPAEMPQAAREAIAMLKVQELGTNAVGHMDALPPNFQRKRIRFHTAP